MRARALLAALAASGTVLVGCGDGPSDDADPLARVAEGVCRVVAQGADIEKAEATFYDRAHDGLHDVADRLAPVDRALSARLLERKQAVESGLAQRPAPPGLAADLAALERVTRDALARLGTQAAPCP